MSEVFETLYAPVDLEVDVEGNRERRSHLGVAVFSYGEVPMMGTIFWI